MECKLPPQISSIWKILTLIDLIFFDQGLTVSKMISSSGKGNVCGLDELRICYHDFLGCSAHEVWMDQLLESHGSYENCWPGPNS